MTILESGFKDLVWATLDTAISVSPGGRTSFLGATKDIKDATSSLLPQFLAIQGFTISGTADDELTIGITWSHNGTSWKDPGDSGAITSIIILDNIIIPTKGTLTQGEVLMAKVQARYFRLDYQATGVASVVISARWASMFDAIYQP